MGAGLKKVAKLCGGLIAKSGGVEVHYDANGKEIVWCVQHKDGWCVVADGGDKPSQATTNAETACGHVVMLPSGWKRRRPTCKACQQALKEGESDVG